MQQRVCVAAAGSQEEVQQEMKSEDQWGSIHIENPTLLKIKWNDVEDSDQTLNVV